MILRKIILEGDHKYEKANNMFPIRWKSHHLTELFIELCPKFELDGSSHLSILATRKRPEYDDKYDNFEAFHVSSYYLEKEEIENLERLVGEEAEKYILNLMEEVLLYIANVSESNEEKSNIIKDAINKMKEQDLSLKKKIKKLSKMSKDRKYKAEVYRCLNRTVGEAWCVEVKYGNSHMTKMKWLTDVPDYLDRTDFFKGSRWEENKFILSNNLGKDIAIIDVDNL